MLESIDRRKFLGNSAAGSAAVGLGLSAARANGSESPNEKIIVGIMGLRRGRRLASLFAEQPNVEIRYVCDVDSLRAEVCAEDISSADGKKPQAITDFRRILDDKQVDALVCAAPNHWHAPATIFGCSADKHVYVEKPCSHNPYEGELMVQAARKYNRAVQVGTQRRSSEGIRHAIAKLHEGVIGRVYLVRCWYDSTRGSIGLGKLVNVPPHIDYDLWQGPAPRRPYRDNVVHYKWHWRWHWGNGELGNNGVHSLDLARWGMNVDFPIRVTSSGGRYHFEDDQETPDTHTVCYEFEGRRSITWQGMSCNKHGSGFVTFYGDQGSLELSGNGSHTTFDRSDKKIEEVDGVSHGLTEHITNFLQAIRENKPLELSAKVLDGHKSALLCHLGNIAHRTGRALNCASENGHILNDQQAMDLWSREYDQAFEPKV